MEQMIGQKVKYARMDQGGKLHESEGVIHGAFIGPDKRLQVRIHDGINSEGRPISYNVDPVAINATQAGLDKYVEHLRAVEKISIDCNASIKSLAAAGNKQIEELNVAYMGPCFDV